MELCGGAAAASGEALLASKEEAEGIQFEPKVDKEQVRKDIARNVLGAFGLRPLPVFDGERYHVGFAASPDLVRELTYDVELLDDFFSSCRRSPSVSNAHEDPAPLPEEPNTTTPAAEAAGEDGPSAEVRDGNIVKDDDNDCVSDIPKSPKEVYYIMEEFYLSRSPTPIDHDVENQVAVGNQLSKEDQPAVEGLPAVEDEPAVEKKQRLVNPRTLKEIYFVMEDNYLSPEEMRLKFCFPELLGTATHFNDAPLSPPIDVPIDCPPERERGSTSRGRVSGANIGEVSTRSNAGKVKGDKGFIRPKKKRAKVIEECDASQSVRPDKPWTANIHTRKRKATHITGPKDPPEEEPPWNGLNVGDLEEQTGESWVDNEKLRGNLEENPGDVVNPAQTKKSFWPTPLYGSPGFQKAPLPYIEEGTDISSFAGSEEESSEVENLDESVEQSRKREEVALAKYALLFKDDQTWRKKFLDGFKLTCDICFSKRKVRVFSSVMSLLAHAQEGKKVRFPEHRGYAQAIRNLLHFDEPGNTPACDSVAGVLSVNIEGVWPPVVVLENTLVGMDLEGNVISLGTTELLHILRAHGDQGKRKLHPVVKENVFTGQVLVEFPNTYRGWIDAKHMHRQFEQHARSYEDWLRLKPKFKALLFEDTEVQESNGLIAVLEDCRSVKRLLYGYLATPRVIKHIDPNKQYVDWGIENLKQFFDISDSDCSQALQR